MDKQSLLDYWEQENIITDKRIFDAFKQVKREQFVPVELKDDAYGDYPLPIGHGQTISQPTTVAIMTQLLGPEQGHRILEVGAGSGYQAAILATVVGARGTVIATEIVPELATMAERNLKEHSNATVFHYDGGTGYGKEQPYDRIIVAAACKQIPQPLVDQLAEGGIIVAPIGERSSQIMVRGVKRNGVLETERYGSFVFVPLTGKHA